jgi:Tfp pilus assembly protein PilZ
MDTLSPLSPAHAGPPPLPGAAPKPRVRPPPLPPAASSRDERGAPRRAAATVEVTYTSGDNFFSGRTRTISEVGLFLETRAQLDVGDPLCVNLHFMKQSFPVRCEVAWVLSDRSGVVGLGLSFSNLTAQAKRAIEAFMVLRDPLSFIVS